MENALFGAAREVACARRIGSAIHRLQAGLAITALVTALVSPASAADGPTTASDPTAQNQALQQKLDAAERRIRELEARLGEDSTPAAAPSVAAPVASTAPAAAQTPAQAEPPIQVRATITPPERDQSRYAPLEALEEKLPSWFPKLLGAQWTVINQNQFPFHSPYSGPVSLNQGGENKTSQTRGVYLGAQATENLQLYLDMEWFVGNGIHGGNGLAGYPNGDVIRAGPANLPKDPYVARVYGRYVFPLSAETEQLPRGMDQLPGPAPLEYVVVKAGKFGLPDDFDTNRYANSVRTQFLNFALINNGAWDYAADTRGYSNGVMLGLIKPDWSLKFGVMQEPKQANGEALDFQIGRAHGSQAELAVKPFGNGTILRFLAFANEARMGRYRRALQVAADTGETPDVTADNRAKRWKYGFGVNAEIPLADDGDTGLFFRAGWNDGQTETWAFTEIDRTLSFGGQLSGIHWGRDEDWLAVGAAVNGLSSAHKDYLAAGGVGFMVGDGRLNYAQETIVETYYSLKIDDFFRFSPDYQFIQNPAYNADRGPVHIASVRIRAAF